MITDDDLIRQLEIGFREDTADLRYCGRVPTPRTRLVPWTAVPVAAAALAVVGLPQLSADAPTAVPAPLPRTPVMTPTATTSPATGRGKVVTEAVKVAGYTFRYQHRANQALPVLHVYFGATIPDDATQVDIGGPDQAWVGTDPTNGDAALWLKAPAGDVSEVSTSDLDQDQLVQFAKTGEPVPVIMTTE